MLIFSGCIMCTALFMAIVLLQNQLFEVIGSTSISGKKEKA
jgi:hypothetical protein